MEEIKLDQSGYHNTNWLQSVAEVILDVVNAQGTSTFSLSDVYLRTDLLSERFPKNRNINAKIRQVLQRLRDIGLISFLGDGNYSLSVDSPDFDVQTTVLTSASDAGQIEFRERSICVRLRNTVLAAELKMRYEYRCQICRSTVELARRDYAEAHHVRPLGTPHEGSDLEGNIIVVCPNHHIMFDRGAICLDPKTFLVRHVRNAFPPCGLYLADWHVLDQSSITYYQDTIRARA